MPQRAYSMRLAGRHARKAAWNMRLQACTMMRYCAGLDTLHKQGHGMLDVLLLQATSNALLLNSRNFLTVSMTVHPIFKKSKWFMHADFKALFDFRPRNTFHAVP